MSHKTHYEIWKFDKDGHFVKKFGAKGSGSGQFIMRARVEGVLGGKYVYTTDAHGRMLFFDLEGNYIKSLKLNYMPLNTVPLNDFKIAVFGHVPWKNNTVKNVISIKDFETGKEDVIWDEIRDPSLTKIELPNCKNMFFTLNFSHPSITRHGMVTSNKGNLIIASHKDGSVSEYTTNGDRITTFPMKIDPVKVSDEDIEIFYEAQMGAYKKFQKGLEENKALTDEEMDMILKEYKNQFESVKDQIKSGEHHPLYSTVIIDSDGNLLVFKFTKKKNSNKFRVYSYNPQGVIIGESSFETKEYELTFTHDTFVFHNGFIYAVATKKNSSGIPLRLVKFKLTEGI